MAIWFAMAFQSGTINIGGYLACHRFVTHTTGFATLFGVEAARGQSRAAFGMLSVPLFFLFGNIISGYLVDRRLTMQLRPHYTTVFGLMTGFMLITFILGITNTFGTFGEELSLSSDYSLLALLCLTSGIQNGTIATVSGSIVRTTHLTGLTTDLGIGLVRIFTKTYRLPREHELLANWMRIGIIISFVLGSCLSGIIFFKAQYYGFVIPLLISFTLSSISYYYKKRTSSQ